MRCGSETPSSGLGVSPLISKVLGENTGCTAELTGTCSGSPSEVGPALPGELGLGRCGAPAPAGRLPSRGVQAYRNLPQKFLEPIFLSETHGVQKLPDPAVPAEWPCSPEPAQLPAGPVRNRKSSLVRTFSKPGSSHLGRGTVPMGSAAQAGVWQPSPTRWGQRPSRQLLLRLGRAQPDPHRTLHRHEVGAEERTDVMPKPRGQTAERDNG